MGSASPLVAFVFVLCFHFPVYSCNKRTIVLRGPTIYRDGHCPGCRNDQVHRHHDQSFSLRRSSSRSANVFCLSVRDQVEIIEFLKVIEVPGGMKDSGKIYESFSSKQLTRTTQCLF